MSAFDKLSIVIPVGPDDNAWQSLLKQLQEYGIEAEIILSACQPQPEYFDFPGHVSWLNSTQGRPRQLNFGAKQSSRPMLWFLHADTRLSSEVIDRLSRFITKDDLEMGYFRLKFANDGPIQTRLNAWAANIRSRYFALPFGDQGFVMNKTLFDQFNGFDEKISLGEDLDFVVRLRANGILLQELPAALITSSRRYQQHGWLSTTIRHLWLTWQLTRQAKRRLVYS